MTVLVGGSAEAALAAGAPADRLVPCDTEGLRAAAAVLREGAATLETGGTALSRVEVTQWRGPASDGFQDTIAAEPARWRGAADAFTAGAAAVQRYAHEVAAARSTAMEALRVYRQYLTTLDAVLAAAGQPSPPAVAGPLAIGLRVAQMQQAAGSSAGPSAAVSAADALRRRALELLAAAQAAVLAAGDDAARALTRVADSAPTARRFWEGNIRPADAVGVGHTALDGLGMLPVLGDPADAANAVWYAADGDVPNAALSAAGLIPLISEAVIAKKLMRGAVVRDELVVGHPGATRRLGTTAVGQLDDGGLVTHELPPRFHTQERHVGKSDADLLARLDEPGNRYLEKASSFATLEDAEIYTYTSLRVHDADIQAWLTAGEKPLVFTLSWEHPVGRTLFRGETVARDAYQVRTVLVKDLDMPNGYRIKTSYPEAER